MSTDQCIRLISLSNAIILRYPHYTKTLCAAFPNPDGNLLGWRQGEGLYQWLSYRQVQERFLALGAGLVQIGFKPKDFMGIFSRNRPEWVIAEQAANAYSMVVVPLYDTLGQEAIEHILNEAQLKIMFCGNDKISSVMPPFLFQF